MKKTNVPTSTGALAKLLRVDRRTVTRWKKRGVPLTDLGALAEWAATQRKLPAGFLERALELRDAGNGTKPATKKTEPPTPDPDWPAFLAQQNGTAPATDPLAALQSLRTARDFASFKYQKTAAAGDRAGMRFFSEQLRLFESSIHDGELRAKRLGVDSEELLPRSEVERVVWAIGYWSLRSVDQHLDSLVAGLVKQCPQLEPFAARHFLEGELLSDRFVTPFARAATIKKNGVSLPQWLVDKMRTTIGDYIEDGESEFDRAATSPVPPQREPNGGPS